jgi:hypothetical protein
MQWLERLIAIPTAFLAAQFPQFFQQYMHELSGHVAELNYQISILQKSAEIAQKPLPALINKFLANSDPDIHQQGAVMQGVIDRLQDFSQAMQSLQHAGILGKPFLFMRYFDLGIVADTWTHFQLGINFSVESIVYLVIGLFLGHGIYLSGRALCSALRKQSNVIFPKRPTGFLRP